MPAIPNPFVEDVFPGGGSVAGVASVGSINAGAIRRLFDDVPAPGEASEGAGRVALLLAPRAGFGKSHLLARVTEAVGARAQVIPLSFNPESQLDWSNVLHQFLRAWELPVGEGDEAIPALDDLARFTFALVNRRLIERGLVPCARPATAARELRENYRKLFDFSDLSQVTARWFGDHFEKLLPLTAAELAAAAGVRKVRATYWLRALCAYAQGAADSPSAREDALRWALADPVEGSASAAVGGMTISQAPAAADLEAEAKGKVADLVRLAAMHRPVVLLIDHLDAYYRDREAGRKLAYMVAEVQAMVPRELTILSLNEDVWESTFQGGLPSAYEDRLTSNVINLKGVGLVEAEALIRERLVAAGVPAEEVTAFVGFLRLGDYFASEGGKIVSPRVLLRYAAIHWDVYEGESAEERRVITAAANGERASAAPVEAEEFPVPRPGDAGGAEDAGEPEEEDGSVLGAGALGAIASAASGLVDAPVSEADVEDAGNPADDGGDGGDGENPFRRLKAMLGKLQEERAAHGVDAEEVLEDPSGEAGFPSVAIEGELSSKAGVGEPVAKDPAQGESVEHVSTTVAAPRSDLSAAPDDSVLGRFRETRARWERDLDPGALEFEKFRNLIEIAGKRFPVVNYQEITVPDHRSNPVASWGFRGNEVLIGFAGSDQGGFWESLGDHALGRAEDVAVKLVGFETAEQRFSVPDSGRSDVNWDIITLERSALASVYAADELLLRAQAGELDSTPGEILGVVASELDPLWKRLTRPARQLSDDRDAA